MIKLSNCSAEILRNITWHGRIQRDTTKRSKNVFQRIHYSIVQSLQTCRQLYNFCHRHIDLFMCDCYMDFIRCQLSSTYLLSKRGHDAAMRCIDRGEHIFPYKIIAQLVEPVATTMLCGPMNWWKVNLKLYNEDTRRYAIVTGQ